MTRQRRHLMVFVAIVAGWMVGATAVFALHTLNEARDDQLRRFTAIEAWARYDGQIASCERGNVLRFAINQDTGSTLELVDCAATIRRPSVPRPKE